MAQQRRHRLRTSRAHSRWGRIILMPEALIAIALLAGAVGVVVGVLIVGAVSP